LESDFWVSGETGLQVAGVGLQWCTTTWTTEWKCLLKKSKTNIKKYEALNYNPVGKIAKKTV